MTKEKFTRKKKDPEFVFSKLISMHFTKAQFEQLVVWAASETEGNVSLYIRKKLFEKSKPAEISIPHDGTGYILDDE